MLVQIDQEGLTLPERSLYLGQDEDSTKVSFLPLLPPTSIPPLFLLHSFSLPLITSLILLPFTGLNFIIISSHLLFDPNHCLPSRFSLLSFLHHLFLLLSFPLLFATLPSSFPSFPHLLSLSPFLLLSSSHLPYWLFIRSSSSIHLFSSVTHCGVVVLSTLPHVTAVSGHYWRCLSSTSCLLALISLCFSDPDGIQGSDGALAEHAGSSQRHTEVHGDYTAGDPSGQCKLIVCVYVCVCVCACVRVCVSFFTWVCAQCWVKFPLFPDHCVRIWRPKKGHQHHV